MYFIPSFFGSKSRTFSNWKRLGFRGRTRICTWADTKKYLYWERYKESLYLNSYKLVLEPIQKQNTSAGHFFNFQPYMESKKCQKFENSEIMTIDVILRFWNFCDFKITNVFCVFKITNVFCVFKITNYCVFENTIIIVFYTFYFWIKISNIFKLEKVRV